MSKVINKDGKWVVVDDQGGVRSTPFTEKSAAESFMNLHDAIVNPPKPKPATQDYGPPAPSVKPAPQPEPSRAYGPAPNVEAYGPPAALVPASQRPWRPADRSEQDIYRVGSDMRFQRRAAGTRTDLPQAEPPGWLSKVNMTTAQWRALLAGLGVQNMPSTPNPKHPEEY